MNIDWNAKEYKQNFHFVADYGKDVLSLIDVPKGSFVVDLGCGNGVLSAELKLKEYDVIGLDASEQMIELAKKLHPDIEFICDDIRSFKLAKKADGIFSNAVLHWIDEKDQQMMLSNIADNIKTGGVFAFEFGGWGCAESVHSTLERIFSAHNMQYKRMFYFPTIGIYAPLLEKAGFKVVYATLFDRFTPQVGESGLADWIKMFDKVPFEGIDEKMTDKIISEAEEKLRDKLYKNNRWYVDYVRLRMKCVKL